MYFTIYIIGEEAISKGLGEYLFFHIKTERADLRKVCVTFWR